MTRKASRNKSKLKRAQQAVADTPAQPRSWRSWLPASVVVVVVLVFLFRHQLLGAWQRREAAQLLADVKLSEAAVMAESARQHDPDNVEGLRLLLSAQRQSEQLDRAAETLQHLSLTNVDARTLLLERTLLLARVGDPATDDSLLAALLASDEFSSTEVSDAFVILYRAFARLDAAELLLDAWEEDSPNDYRTAAHRGLLAQMKMDVPAAVTEFQRAIREGDPRASTRLHLGRCLLEVRDVAAAVASLKDAAARRADDVATRIVLSDALLQSGDADGAEHEAQQALLLDPASWDADLLLTRIEISREHFDEALHHVERLLADWPADRDALHNKSVALRGLGRAEESQTAGDAWKIADQAVLEMEALLRQLQSDASSEDLRTRAGVLMMKHYSRTSAVELLEAALRANRDNTAARECLDDYFARRQRRREVKTSSANTQPSPETPSMEGGRP